MFTRKDFDAYQADDFRCDNKVGNLNFDCDWYEKWWRKTTFILTQVCFFGDFFCGICFFFFLNRNKLILLGILSFDFVIINFGKKNKFLLFVELVIYRWGFSCSFVFNYFSVLIISFVFGLINVHFCLHKCFLIDTTVLTLKSVLFFGLFFF